MQYKILALMRFHCGSLLYFVRVNVLFIFKELIYYLNTNNPYHFLQTREKEKERLIHKEKNQQNGNLLLN